MIKNRLSPQARIPRLSALLLGICLVAGSTAVAQQQTVSRTPPPLYEKQLRALLTPLEEVLKASKTFEAEAKEDDYSGVILLNEVLHYIDGDGRRIKVIHYVFKAFTESGAKAIGDDTFHYRQKTQRIHLAKAQTVTADGRRMEIKENAAIIRVPQRDAGASLYSDDAELVLVFPKVEPGAVTESIVVIEEDVFPIPGEFSATLSWGARWPVALKRRLVEMATPMAGRLQIVDANRRVPEMRRETLGNGRVRMRWEKRKITGRRYERSSPSTVFSAPTTWLTTLPDWNAFAKWYNGLIRERFEIGEELAAKVEEWTEGIEDDREVVARLLSKVANEVRYTGMEFGQAGLQPYECNEVWENRYGDCKDKANLLRALLAHKGIRSYLTLVNTNHAGQVEKRSPGHGQFNHAILAVDLGSGYLFCDPTVEYSKPGLLSPGDVDREVLLIKGDVAEWARTPKQRAGSLNYRFELERDRAGGISGWMTLEAEGYYACSYADSYVKRDRRGVISGLADLVDGFFPAAEVIDVVRPEGHGEAVDSYVLKAYFVVPTVAADDASGDGLLFPFSEKLMVDLGDSRERKEPFSMWSDVMKVDAVVELPEGVAPEALPRPFSVESPAISARASWEKGESAREYRARLSIDYRKALVPVGDYGAAFNAIRSLRSWLGRPLILDTGGSSAPAVPEVVSLENFPIMPTGSGQLELLERRFPENGNEKLRIEALRRVLQYFPDDVQTRVYARAKIGLVDWNADRNEEAAKKFIALLSESEGKVSASDRAWLRYLLALAKRDCGEEDEALKLFEGGVDDGGANDSRRAWSGYRAALMLEKKGGREAKVRAVGLLRRALGWESDARVSCFELLAKLVPALGEESEFGERLADLLKSNDAEVSEILNSVVESARGLGETGGGLALAEVLEGLPTEEGSEVAAHLSVELEQLMGGFSLGGILVKIRDDLSGLVEASRDETWEETAPPDELLTNRKALTKRCDSFWEEDNVKEYIRHMTDLLTRFDPDDDYAQNLWRLALWVEWDERDKDRVLGGNLLPFLFKAMARLPVGEDSHWEGKFLRADYYQKRGNNSGELEELRAMDVSRNLPEDYRDSLDEHLGASLVRNREFAESLPYFEKGEGRSGDEDVCDGLLVAGFICLETGRATEALRRWGLLREMDEGVFSSMSYQEQAEQARDLLADPDAARKYWRDARRWWRKWDRFRERYGVERPASWIEVPVFEDLEGMSELGSRLGGAFRSPGQKGFGKLSDQIAHAARWLPSFGNHLGRFLIILSNESEDTKEATALRKMGVEILEGVRFGKPAELRQARLWQGIGYVDLERHEKMVDYAVEFLASDEEADAVNRGIVQLWAMSAIALDSEFDEVQLALENILKDQEKDERARTVSSLVSVYRATGNTKAEEMLLKVELENPKVKADESRHNILSARYKDLAQSGVAAEAFARAVGRWLERNRPDWWDYVLPNGLADPRVGDLDKAFGEASRLNRAERIKLELLVAEAADMPLDEKESHFQNAIYELGRRTFRWDESRRIFDSLITDPDLRPKCRAVIYLFACGDALREEGTDQLKRYLTMPPPAPGNAFLKGMTEYYNRLARHGTVTGSEIEKAIRSVVGTPMGGSEIGGVMLLFERLASMGDWERMDRVRKGAGDWQLKAGTTISLSGLRLSMLREIKAVKKGAGLRAAVSELVQGYLAGADEGHGVELAKQWKADIPTSRLAFDDALSLTAQRLRSGHLALHDPNVCRNLLRLASEQSKRAEFSFPVFEAVLTEASDDLERSSAILGAPYFFDTDDDAVVTKLLALVEPYSDATEHPFSAAALRFFKLECAVRRGRVKNLRAAVARIDHPHTVADETRLVLISLISAGDVVRLRSAIDATDADELLSPGMLKVSIRAFERAGMKDLEELAREEGRSKLPALIAESWLDGNFGGLWRAIGIAQTLGDAKLIPEALVESFAKHMGNSHRTSKLRCEMALLQHDWDLLAEQSAALIESSPTLYYLYWMHGLALYELGRMPEAVKSLRVYVRYSHDELEHPRAQEILDKIAKGEEAVDP